MFVNGMLVIIIKRFGAVYLGVLLYTVDDIAAKTPLRRGRMCYSVNHVFSSLANIVHVHLGSF